MKITIWTHITIEYPQRICLFKTTNFNSLSGKRLRKHLKEGENKKILRLHYILAGSDRCIKCWTLTYRRWMLANFPKAIKNNTSFKLRPWAYTSYHSTKKTIKKWRLLVSLFILVSEDISLLQKYRTYDLF